jgi:pyruvate,water dikinase
VSGLVFRKDLTADIDTTVPFIAGGRIWINLSNTFTIGSLATHEKLMHVMDPVCAQALGSVEEESYRGEHSIRQVPWNLLWSVPEKAAQIFEARLLPEHARKSVESAREQHLREVRALTTRDDEGLHAFATKAIQAAAHTVFSEILPYFVVSKLAMSRLRDIFADATPAQQLDLAKLDQSLPGNVTVEMGLGLAELAQALPAGTSLEALESGLAARTLPAAFLAGWDAFLAQYGHRGPREIDVAARRYREEPRMLLTQIAHATSPSADAALAPHALYERSQRERQEAFERLAEVADGKGFIASRRFRSLGRVVECLGGLRESPKFHIVLGFDAVRTRALAVGEGLHAAGRIDTRDDVFDLSFDDIDAALAEPALDIRALVVQNRADRTRYNRSKEKPRLIDSRGRIIRPRPAPLQPGELSGFAVSTGTARGRVKVLHTPDEKPLQPGEILVARATDPGWTPLFVNAGAVVLEVGGMMQHGALVAREYGKPCVVGIEDATGRLHDGDLVEVDGTAGVVRVVEKAARG